MSYVKFRVTESTSFPRPAAAGDLVGLSEVIPIPAVSGTAGATLSVAQFLSTFITVTGATTATPVTTPTASDICSSVTFNPGDTFRHKVINSGAGAVTITAGTGVTVTSGVVNGASVKEFLTTITAPGPAVVAPTCVTTINTKIITGMTQAQTDAAKIGMLVTGTNAGASAKVVGIQSGIGITVDVNSTASSTAASPVVLTLSPSVTITGIGQGLV